MTDAGKVPQKQVLTDAQIRSAQDPISPGVRGVASIEDPAVIGKISSHLGVNSEK
jgi:hypothetical protein